MPDTGTEQRGIGQRNAVHQIDTGIALDNINLMDGLVERAFIQRHIALELAVVEIQTDNPLVAQRAGLPATNQTRINAEVNGLRFGVTGVAKTAINKILLSFEAPATIQMG